MVEGAETAPIVPTTSGHVRGRMHGGIVSCRGIPYAAPPVGGRRFAPPQPVSAPPVIIDATRQGPTAPQPDRPFPAFDASPIDGPGWRKGDDYLCVNAWTSSLTGKRPVMVFVHGGSFVGGCGDATAYDGTSFAREGVVLFSFNYRLGLEGFMPLPGGATNIGLRDQIAALAWVRRNAAAFGGDPDDVTVFGQSAGGMSVACLLVSPLARGLFRRAIVQSGGGTLVRSVEACRPLTDFVGERLGGTASADALRLLPLEFSVETTAALMQSGVLAPEPDGRDCGYGLSPFLPVHGDEVLPKPPLEALAEGAGAEVDLLVGVTSEEANLFFETGLLDPDIVLALLRAADPSAFAIVQARIAADGAAASTAHCLGDLIFRQPALDYASAHRGATHFYEFDWRSPACEARLGACHGLDLPFVFNTVDLPAVREGMLGGAAPTDLAAKIHRIWIEFAEGNRPPWPSFSREAPFIMRLAEGRAVEARTA